MPEFITIQEHRERRTYIKGQFVGKFMGYLDFKKSDIINEKIYDLEVLSGEIKTNADEDHILHWETGEPLEFQPIEQFLTALPPSLPLEVTYDNGTTKSYQINLNEPKLSNFYLTKQVYEDERVFGNIEGDISGYIRHYEIVDRKIEVISKEEGIVVLPSTIASINEPEHIEKKQLGADYNGLLYYNGVEIIPKEDGTATLPPKNFSVKTSKPTGRTEVSGNYKRWEYYKSDGTAYWGNWIKESNNGCFSFLSFLFGVLHILYFLAIAIAIFTIGWKLFLPLIIIGGIFYLSSAFQPVIIRLWGWLIRLLGFAFVMLLIFGIVSLLINPINTIIKKKYVTNSDEEIQNTSTEPPTGDSIISHYRVWQDYNKNEYSGIIRVTASDYRNVADFRNNVSVSSQDPNQYNNIVSKIYDFDKNKLSLLYLMFDSLKTKHHLSESKFAEVITSCIQDIPYTLVLDNDCNANKYNDKFISEYLGNGGKCEGYIKFGLLSPTEFMGSLIGDCDTRTLLLFTILNHYNYDVAMLGSELYRHSVIGINLPYKGISKTINGTRYVIWETTEQGIPPGIFPHELSDMRYWNVTLISKHNSSI